MKYQELYTIENKNFKVSLVKEEKQKFKVLFNVNSGGEFNRNFNNYIDAVTFFDQIVGDLYQNEQDVQENMM